MSEIPSKVVDEMLDAAGNRRDALLHVLYKHDIIKEPVIAEEVPDDATTEGSEGTNAAVEGAESTDEAGEEVVPTEATES